VYEIPTIEAEPGTEPVAPTVRRMADVLVGKRPVDISAAFDRGSGGVATLVLEDAPPIWPRNPVPSGSGPRKKAAPARQRPAGAEDLEGLFATGFILLTVFVIGEWASPTADESTAIARPLANILARRIDLAARLGRDASDTIALAIAVLSYLARVGPIAAERVREQVAARGKRERVVRDQRPAEGPPDGGGAGSVAFGSDNGARAYAGSPLDPFHALTQARAAGLGFLDRDLGASPGDAPAVGDQR
jgi:hypothetical protein